MAKYLSNKFKSLKVGIDSFSENLTSLSVVGKVGIGSTLSLNSVTGIVSAVSFKRHGGTSSEFLMADGSVNNSSFISSYTETDTLDTVLGRGNISGIGLSVGVVTSTSFRGDLIGNVTGNADTATTAGTVTTAAQPNITSVGTLASLTVQGNVSVGGTLTYEDVTNVDALGIVTARSGIHVGPISAGVATVTTDGSATFIGIITAASFAGSGANLTSIAANQLSSGTIPDARFPATLPAASAANLTNIPAGNLTGTVADARISTLTASKLSGALPAISGANLTDVLTTGVGGQIGNLTVAGIASVGIGTTGDALVGKVDLFHEGEIRLKTTPAGIQVVGILSATSLDFTGANGAFNDDLLLKGASANAKWDKSESYLQFNDGAKAVFGTDVSSGDLEIYHSGNHSYINEDGTGELLITTGIGTTAAKVSDGSITLYHEGVERLKTTASGVTISGNISGTISGTINGNASTATDLAITGATQQLVIQTGDNATNVIDSGTTGYVLQSNGSGNAPTWATGAPANAISGITLREDGVLVGSANSISTINFTGAGVGVTFTQPTAGIATVTISSGGGDSASPVMMSMIFG